MSDNTQNLQADLQLSNLRRIFFSLLGELDRLAIKTVLDVNTGSISLPLIAELFPVASVDAVIRPGDKAIRDNIKECVKPKNYILTEYDLLENKIELRYDLIFVYALFSTAADINMAYKLAESLLLIPTFYIAIIDYFEPGCLRSVRKAVKQYKYSIVDDHKFHIAGDKDVCGLLLIKHE